jgi:hypothetical protein
VVHERRTIEAALELAAAGVSASTIARQLAVPRSTVSAWLSGALPRHPHGDGGRCGDEHAFDLLPPGYVYLLGLYLGDGCLSIAPATVPKLRIALDVRYPGIIAEAKWAIERVRGVAGNGLERPRRYVEVYSYWKHWPCLFPQHGAGKKHERDITLATSQRELVERWPWELLRGLIHSDGCRFTNTGTKWRAPRYSFKQRSEDIRAIFRFACRQMGMRFTEAPETIYVSRKADVATLDMFVGPKR